MSNIVFFTGAGVSKESGISTFRDTNGLWENFKIEDVASKRGWQVDRSRVLDFYNKRRNELKSTQPNPAHEYIAELQKKHNVTVITQNVDDLHERAGSKNVVHLHGELLKMRSSKDPSLIYDCFEDILEGHKCELGSQLRPHIVWFGEQVPEFDKVISTVESADIFVIVGTSMQVYPAASLINYLDKDTPIIYLDPSEGTGDWEGPIEHIRDTAVSGVKKLDVYLEKLSQI